MCRFVAYLGEPMLLVDVLVKPEDSLVKQSLYAEESTTRTNGDGFGIGWYMPKLSPEPALFVSMLPAWNDINLLHLTNKTESSCFFAHVRAASSGAVALNNCHPFSHKQWMFMHNGGISDFLSIKRALCNLLDEAIYNTIKGQTDSEHLFALFLQLAKGKKLSNTTAVFEILKQTFKVIDDLLKSAGKKNNSYFNICLTDGKRIIATRYCPNPHLKPETLHYWVGPYYWSKEDCVKNYKASKGNSVLIASEMLTKYNSQWQVVPNSHCIVVEKNAEVRLLPLD